MRMKLLLLVFCTMQLGALCSRFKIFHPAKIRSIATAEINSTLLQKWNDVVFGLSADNAQQKNDLFRHPKVFVVVSVAGIETLEHIDGENIDLAFVGEFDLGNIDNKLTKLFGNDMQRAKVGVGKITGSKIAKIAKNVTLGKTIGIDNNLLRMELINMYKLGEAIKNRNASSKKNAIDFYRISLDIPQTGEDIEQITTEIRTSIQDFYENVKQSYGKDEVVLEIYTHMLLSAQNISHYLHDTRKMYNVATFASIDKPAIDGIFYLVVIAFSFAVLAAVIHMFESDMSKNSLVYRLTNVKTKKEL